MERKEALKVALVLFASLVSLWYIQKAYREFKFKQILDNPAVAVGVITQIGRYVTVDFKADGNTYSVKRRVPEELLQGRVPGDTAVVIYARTDPDNAALKKGFTRLLEN